MFAVISAILHIIPLKDDIELFYPLAIFEEYTPEWKEFFSGLYRASFISISFIMIIPCYLLIYMSSHVRFEFYMFLQILKNINLDGDPLVVIQNPKYQARIKKRLIYCIKQHTYLLK